MEIMENTSVKDAQYFLDHPEENPSLEDLGAVGLLNEDGSLVNDVPEKEISEKEPLKDADTGDKGEEDLKEKEPSEKEGPPRDEKGKFVSTKDGEGKIPYEVLSGARREAAEAKAHISDLQTAYEEQIQANKLLADHLRSISSGKSIAEPDGTGEVKTPNIDPRVYREEFGDEIGDLADAFKQQMEINANMLAKIQELKEVNEFIVRDKESETVEMVQSLIDKNEKLADWQVNDPKKFDMARQFDNNLIEDPSFKGMPLSKRFEKVVGLVEALYGVETKPNTDMDATVKDAVSKVKPASITSLSQIDATIQDLHGTEKVESMSINDIHASFEKMNEAQREKWIRDNLGGG